MGCKVINKQVHIIVLNAMQEVNSVVRKEDGRQTV